MVKKNGSRVRRKTGTTNVLLRRELRFLVTVSRFLELSEDIAEARFFCIFFSDI